MPSSLAADAALVTEVFPVGDPFTRLADRDGAFVLRSSLAESGDARARWTLFGAEPFAAFRGGDHSTALAAFHAFAARGAASLRDALGTLGAPFAGGAVGYWAYDFGRRFERLPTIARDDLGLPEFVLALYDTIGVHDHATGRTWLCATGLPADGHDRTVRAHARTDAWRAVLESPLPPRVGTPTARAERTAHSTFDADAYRTGVEVVREAIRRGDLFQANLSQRWRLALPHAADLVVPLDEALRHCTPSPFAATLALGDHTVWSASPERFLRVTGRTVETRPIKGTRPRGTDETSDAALADDLRASVKDRAENVMIVDVLRNDLGRVCTPGSVRVPELCALERFPQVWHLTSTVTGALRDDVSAFDLLHACFPGGSITGAPKIRAMELLETLEPVRRHLYTGAIGWVGWNGDADWNIAIRTAVGTRDAIVWSAGGGITADSDPDAEYRESLTKGAGLRLALEHALGPVRLA